MKQIGLLVGEDCDLPSEILKKNYIHTFPYLVFWNSNSKSSKTYSQMRTNKENNSKDVLQTSQPSLGQFKTIYEKLLKEYSELIVLTLSSEISGTYNAAVQALKLLHQNQQDKVTIIDTRHISVSEGLLVCEIVKIIKQNKSLKGIIDYITTLKQHLVLTATVEDPYWLELGGRIGPVKSMIVRQLMRVGVRPLFGIKDGKVELLKIKGDSHSKEELLLKYFDEQLQLHPNLQIKIGISHADDKNSAENIKQQIERRYKNCSVEFITEISTVLGAHIGPGGIILGWIYT